MQFGIFVLFLSLCFQICFASFNCNFTYSPENDIAKAFGSWSHGYFIGVDRDPGVPNAQKMWGMFILMIY
jgi:hypothetical protein